MLMYMRSYVSVHVCVRTFELTVNACLHTGYHDYVHID